VSLFLSFNSFDERFLSRSVDGKQDGDKVSSDLARGEELVGSPVSLDGCDVGLDGLLVKEIVLGRGGDQLSLVREDLGPGLDGCDIVAHSVAGSSISLEVVDEAFEIFEGREDMEGFKILQGSLQVAPQR